MSDDIVTNNLKETYSEVSSGTASTSSYIQQNVSEVKNFLVDNTPDDSIIDSNLEKITCSVDKLENLSIDVPEIPSLDSLTEQFKQSSDSVLSYDNLKKYSKTLTSSLNNISLVAKFNSISSMVTGISKKLGIGVPKLQSEKKEVKIEEPKPDKTKAEYGKIIVNEMPGGFVSLKDSTEGSKRILDLHPSGTYHGVIDDGTATNKVVGDCYSITDKNWYVTIGEDFVTIISGNNQIQIKKDSYTTIEGSQYNTVKGESYDIVKGNKCNQYEENLTESVTNDKSIEIEGNNYQSIHGSNESMIYGSDRTTVMGNQNTIIGKQCNIQTGEGLTISSKGAIKLISATSISLIAPSIDLG